MNWTRDQWFQVVSLLVGSFAVTSIALAALIVLKYSAVITPIDLSPGSRGEGSNPESAVSTSAQNTVPTFTPDLVLLATSIAIQTHPPALATTERPVGILDDVDTGLFAMGYALENSWQRQINGYWALVEAGSLKSDPDQGIVFATWDIPNTASGGLYRTPRRAGAVRIIAEADNRLTLQAADGTLFYFDVPGQAFVASLHEIIPTVTPGPTFTVSPPEALQPTGYPLPGYSGPGTPAVAIGYP